MSGVPSPKIRKLWNMANVCLDNGWTPSQYWKESSKDTQAINAVHEARMRKQIQEKEKHV